MKRKDFDHCIKENELIEIGLKDKGMAKELLELAEHKEQFWKEVDKSSKYPSLYIEGHYEIIKELCTAILALDGWKSLNHECLFAYIRSKKDLELDFDYLLELKDTRNAIDYRGVRVSAEIWNKNKLKIEIIIKTLKEYVKKCL
ncbi:MAG: hypothetical protein KAT77_00170 [Nanoarchaeota archaeon]|nr:hypothetical protein [Nanoarchaeota archaeon]